MTVLDIIKLLGGLAMFLYGMRLMGDGLKKNSGGTMQRVLEKVTNNPFKGFLLGFLVTALIQSSKATIVLTAGLVGAGVLTLSQSIGIVLGANVGTTVTGQIIRLMDLDSSGGAGWLNYLKPSALAPMAAILAIAFIMFIKSRNSSTVGEIAMGFAILFTGLNSMTSAVDPLSESQAFVDAFSRFAGQPFFGFLAGMIVAIIFQSQSASVGMLQTLSTTGALTFSNAFPILLGIFLGDAITTALVCSAGAQTDAKRTGVVTILFNIVSLVFLIAAVLIAHASGWINSLWNSVMTSGSIANVNTLAKLVSALVFVPFSGIFFRLSHRLVRDEAAAGNIILDAAIAKLDTKLYISPIMALNSARSVIKVMQRMAAQNTKEAFKLILDFNEAGAKKVCAKEECIDAMADAVDEYLIHLSSHIDSDENSEVLNLYLQSFSEVERIGDHAVNLVENAQLLHEKNRRLSAPAQEELKILAAAVNEIMEETADSFIMNDPESAKKIEPLEEVIDDLVAEMKAHHLQRVREGKCGNYVGITFNDILINVERISDQCANMALYVQALHDPRIMHNRHSYIQNLHAGKDPYFNRVYEAKSNEYTRIVRAMKP